VEEVGFHAVGGGEQPAGQAGVDFVQSVAEHGLGDLHQLKVGEGVHQFPQHPALEEFGADDGGLDAESVSGALHVNYVRHLGLVEERGRPENPSRPMRPTSTMSPFPVTTSVEIKPFSRK